jgi:hypothetical protein
MGSGEQSGSGDRVSWPVRLATAVGVVVGAALGLMFRRDLGGFWQGVIAFAAVVAVGALLGRLAGSLLFRRRPGR